jgi:hypothetical protein
MKMKNLLLFLIMVGFVNYAKAQDQKFSALATIGVSSPILDNGIGFHLGLNPCLRLTERISAEGQISYIYSKIGSSFLKGEQGYFNSINTLAGGRLYFNSGEKKNRFFFNLLVGLNYKKEEENNIEKDGEANLGFSSGVFMDLSRITLGLTYDTPQNLILKLGYSF